MTAARYRRPAVEKSWQKCRIIGHGKDGSVTIADQYSGGVYSILPEHVQEQVTGPRGGRSWKPLTSTFVEAQNTGPLPPHPFVAQASDQGKRNAPRTARKSLTRGNVTPKKRSEAALRQAKYRARVKANLISVGGA